MEVQGGEVAMLRVPVTCLKASFVLFIAALTSAASAETSVVRISRQPSLPYLALMVMEEQKLMEKHARAAGLGEVTVGWLVVGGGNATNEALLSGNLEFGNAGIPAVMTAWDRTKNSSNPIKAVCAYNSAPVFLNTRNSEVKTIRDFTQKDKIALPAVKVSIQALILQMAAAQTFGKSKYNQLDNLTVSLPQVDANQALLSGVADITANFASPPTQYQQLKHPGIRTILNSYDVLGGPATLGLVYTSSKFHDSNPKTYAAFLAAYREANEFIRQKPHEAAQLYLRVSKDRNPAEFILSMIKDPGIDFDMVPKGLERYAGFMHEVGTIRNKPSSWKDLVFPEMHQAGGS